VSTGKVYVYLNVNVNVKCNICITCSASFYIILHYI